MIASLFVFSSDPMGRSSHAMRDAGLGQVGLPFNVREEGSRVCLHRSQLAPYIAAGPQAIVSRQACGRVLVARRRPARFREGFGRFQRAVAARRDKRVGIGHLQLKPLA